MRRNKINHLPQDIIKKYHALKNVDQTAIFFDISDNTVRRILKKNNINIYINDTRKYTCDDDFFSKDTEEAFYWAGFIAADGNISKSKRRNTRFSINLSIKDIEHLEKFKKCIKSDAKIRTFLPKAKPQIDGRFIAVKEKCQIGIGSVKMVNDLKRFGVIPGKTYIFNIPDEILNNKNIWHFIRGYFDGDGMYIQLKEYEQYSKKHDYHYTTKKKLNWGMCGTEKFMQQIICLLDKNNIKHSKIIKQENIFRIFVRSPLDVFNITNLQYKNATNYLDRKYEISKTAEFYLEQYKEGREYLFDKKFIVEGLIKYKTILNFSRNIDCDKRTIKRYMNMFDITMENLYDS